MNILTYEGDSLKESTFLFDSGIDCESFAILEEQAYQGAQPDGPTGLVRLKLNGTVQLVPALAAAVPLLT